MLQIRLQTPILLVTAVAGVACCFRPMPIVAEYNCITPFELPQTVLLSDGLGGEPVEKDAEELYRAWHRAGWQEYARRFLWTPDALRAHLDVDLASDDDLPTWKYWLADFEAEAERDGFYACRDTLRRLVLSHGVEHTRERLEVRWPIEDDALWAEFAREMGFADRPTFTGAVVALDTLLPNETYGPFVSLRYGGEL